MSKPVFTLAEGQPLSDPSVSTTLPLFGGGSLTTLGDTLLLETLAHFNRERIPERVVHAKATGAWGEFEVTNKNISSLTTAKFLSSPGKKTKVLFRLSTVGGEKGSADTVRDVRGFAVKFFTEQGNFDIVGNDIPVFFVRDPVRFPSLNRSHKKHPATNRPDWTMFWDFHVNQPESVHTLMHLFGTRGIPDSIRRVNGFGVHTFKLVDNEGSFKYCKFHFRPAQGIGHLSDQEAERMAGVDPDFHTKDLWDAIARGKFPVWKLYIQVMEPRDAEKHGRMVFDITKVWPHKEFPLIEVGQMTLTQNVRFNNPRRYMTSLTNTSPEGTSSPRLSKLPSRRPTSSLASPHPQTQVSKRRPLPKQKHDDKSLMAFRIAVLQARMFAYPDAQRYRLGVNYAQLPPNRPIAPVYAPYERDGVTSSSNYGGDANYVRGTMGPGEASRSATTQIRHLERVHSAATLGLNELAVTEEDFEQPRVLWQKVFDEAERARWISAVRGTLGGVPPALREAVRALFSRVDAQIGLLLSAKVTEASHL